MKIQSQCEAKRTHKLMNQCYKELNELLKLHAGVTDTEQFKMLSEGLDFAYYHDDLINFNACLKKIKEYIKRNEGLYG